MTAANPFLARFAAAIVATLGCFDRVIFKGHLPFGDDACLNRFVDHVLRIPRKDFLPLMEKGSQSLVRHGQRLAAEAGVPYRSLQGRHSREELIQELLRQRRAADGLPAVLCCQECCRTVKLLDGKDRPRLTFARRPQRVLYFYFLDADFGLIHVRIQAGFPFTVQVHVNGHEGLARQLQQHGIGFVQIGNAFTQLDQPTRAQQLADRFAGSTGCRSSTAGRRRSTRS